MLHRARTSVQREQFFSTLDGSKNLLNTLILIQFYDF
jgi:hypothetical protein